ncbi:hypothetical protein JK358_38375 [Nocardia sp. 2]|uniref:ATP-grasp domain-containing protein n=1 Tax=Nocardia acididurans TaxID=2802282 RepID=A0ABS1MI70_9NOCA|nr:hypothetical protein [Nocardia acididurans]MBL1080279.1 hypothetical protein [Nocardia acididurans]
MRQHIVVISPWSDRCVHYTDYVDHGHYAVSYICTEYSASTAPPTACAVEIVDKTSDVSAVSLAARELVQRFGAPARILAFSESDLEAAARLRAEFDVPGDQWERILRFRDKLVMSEMIAAAGVSLPAFADAPDKDAVSRFARTHGWPVVVKPRSGAGSRGFVKLNGPAELDAYSFEPVEPRVVQSFCAAPVGHVDGFWDGEQLGGWRASRCLMPPSEYLAGLPYASVEIDDPALIQRLGDFTARVCAAMSADPFVFHLEVFLDGENGAALSFLEIGARVGGAEIPFIWHEIHERDLFAVAADLQMGRPPAFPEFDSGVIGGWMLVPTPVSRPCVVTGVALDLPAGEVGPYARVLPQLHAVIPATSGYEHCGARFRFVGPSTAAVESSIRRTAAGLRLQCVPARSVAAL